MLERSIRRALRHPAIIDGMTRLASALGTSWAVLDDDDNLLAGDESARGNARLPLPVGTAQLWLAAPSQGPALLAALDSLLALERERTVVAAEALDKYREVNLLFHIHEVIGSTLDARQVMRSWPRRPKGWCPARAACCC